MVKKASAKARIFKKGWLVTLAIPSKLQLRTELKRLLCWIVKVTKNQYSLDSTKGPLSGSHSALQLNPVESPDQNLVSINWPAGTPKLTINKAVQLVNNRGTIAAAQKAAWLANRIATEPVVQSVPERQQGCKRKRQKRTGSFNYSG
jgi:hypothetical protein